jgi:DNA-binding transcriptional MerR regulator
MNEELFTLRDACDLLRIQAHVLVYLIRTGKVAEPRRIGGRRMFTHADLAQISEVLKAAAGRQQELYGQK